MLVLTSTNNIKRNSLNLADLTLLLRTFLQIKNPINKCKVCAKSALSWVTHWAMVPGLGGAVLRIMPKCRHRVSNKFVWIKWLVSSDNFPPTIVSKAHCKHLQFMYGCGLCKIP